MDYLKISLPWSIKSTQTFYVTKRFINRPMKQKFLKTISVLIADDRELDRRGMKAMLQTESKRIEIIEVFPKAEVEIPHLVQKYKPMVLLLDLDWNDDYGTGVLRDLPAWKRNYPETRIVCVTNFPELIPEAQRKGADAALSKGFSIDQIVATIFAVANDPPKMSAEETVEYHDLTERELDVLRLIAQDMGDKEIANYYTISIYTIKHHVAAIIRKLEAQSRTGAVAKAYEMGILKRLN